MPASTCATGIRGLGGGERARERRVGVAVDEHDVRLLGSSSGPSAASIRAVCAVFVPPPRSSRCSGRGSAELVEEDLRQLVVVVLAGVDHDLARDRAQRARDRGRLDELRPVPDDREDAIVPRGRRPRDAHAGAACRSRATRRVNAACAASVTGPGADGSSIVVDGGDRQHLADRRRDERLLRAARGRRACRASRSPRTPRAAGARVIESRMRVVQRRGDRASRPRPRRTSTSGLRARGRGA